MLLWLDGFYLMKLKVASKELTHVLFLNDFLLLFVEFSKTKSSLLILPSVYF